VVHTRVAVLTNGEIRSCDEHHNLGGKLPRDDRTLDATLSTLRRTYERWLAASATNDDAPPDV
jgi:hypothetical protein